MRNSTLSKDLRIKSILTVSSVFTMILLFFVLYLVIDNDLAFASPFDTFKALMDIIGNGNSYLIISSTIVRVLEAMLISFVIGGILGFLAGYFKYVRYFVDPILSILRTIPLASIILIILLILSRSQTPVLITCLVIIPLVYEGFKEGIMAIQTDLMDVWKLDSKMNAQIFFRVVVPLTSPHIVSALFQSLGLAFKVMVMSEYLAYIDNSIGKELVSAGRNLESDYLFAWTLILVIIVIIIEAISKLIISKLKYLKA